MAQSKSATTAPIEALLREKRKFPPPKNFVKRALVSKASVYTEAARNPVRFWEARARELTWFKPWKKVLEWKPPYAKWFVGGKLNVSLQLPRPPRRRRPRRNKAAMIWEGEPGDTPHADATRICIARCSRFANALKRSGVRQGRPRRDLHADDPRAGDRHARLRADRRGALA